MAQINGYKEELQDELQKTDPNSHASRLLAQEIERLEKGEDRKDNRSIAFIDVHPDQPQPVGLKIRIPVQEFPKFNFVGKLLGPKGNTLKRLQEETGCKMAILGKGSMRDKSKEEELRKEGGKFAHLNDELHVYVEAFAEMTDGYRRLSHAVTELKKFLIPTSSTGLDEKQHLILSQKSPLIKAFQQLLAQVRAPSPMIQQQAPMILQRAPLLRSQSPMSLERAPMFQPRGPMFPPHRPMCPQASPFPPRPPLLPPRAPMFPPQAPMFPPQAPMFPFQLCAPMVKPRKEKPKPNRKPTPWYASIRHVFHHVKRERRRAERKWLKSRLPADREAFLIVKRKFNTIISKAKAAYEASQDPKKTPEESAGDPENTLDETPEGLCKDITNKSSDDESISGDDDSSESDDCTDDLTKDSEDSLKDSPEILEGNDDIRQQQLQEMMYINAGDAPPRGGGRGGFRGGRGGPAVRGGPPAPVRGAPRGVAPGRGAPRGVAGAPRGAAPMRGAARGRGGGAPPPPPQSSSYDDYGYGGSSRGGGGGSYDDGYDSRGYGESSYSGGQGDGQYYGSSSYGSGGQSAAGTYDDYGSYNDYGDSWGSNGSGGGPMKSSRGGAKPRSHPYGGGRGGY